MEKKEKIVFFGTPEFAVPTLKALYKEGYNVVLAVTQPDKPVGRKQVLTPSAVKVEAGKMALEVFDKIKGLRPKIEDLKPTLGVVAAYGQILPKEILDLFPKGCLNIHPSLLPKYRGPSPIQAAILNGDKETGVSIIKLDREMDHGGHVAYSIYYISNDETAESLLKKLADEGAKLLIKTLPYYLAGKIKPVAQDDSQATITKLLKREDGEIDWHKSAVEIERQIRAYYPWPGSFTYQKIIGQRPISLWLKESKNQLIKILSLRRADDVLSDEIGKFQSKDGQLYVKCGKGTLIIDKLQPEGKKVMTAKEFINGYLK